MMEVTSGLVRVSKGSDEDKEFTSLLLAVKGLPEDFLIRYHNEIIKLSEYDRTSVQDMMLSAISVVRDEARLERY